MATFEVTLCNNMGFIHLSGFLGVHISKSSMIKKQHPPLNVHTRLLFISMKKESSK